MIEIAPLSRRPDLAPTVARWLWDSFRRSRGDTFDASLRDVRAATGPGLPLGFVLIEDGRPQGTASLAVRDLPTRPELSPWLAGVYVEPAARGRGHGARLVRAVEEEARGRGFDSLWLFTRRAEPLYARLGWRRVGTELHRARYYALMRRDL
jgi:GNAT superfamily N-acetyltransferase